MTSPDSPDLGWSDRQLRALSAIFATICEPTYDGETDRHAQLAAAALTEVAEPLDLRQLRLILDLFEAPVGVPGFSGLSAFSRLPLESREKLLRAWATSRLPQRRTFFQTVKRLGAFFAYADPGLDVRNPRWSAMGYAMPDHEHPEPGPVAEAVIRPEARPLDLEFDADVVVVGSGAGGGVVAARLAEAGLGVVVVEAGPYVPESEMQRDELDAFNRMYLDHAMTSTADLSVAILAGAAVGGGTLINWTTCFEPPAELRGDWTRRHGLEGFDGESTDADLARLRLELGFATPPSIGPKDQLILDGAAALDWEAAPTERNADGCTDCGACPFGCKRGAKRSGQTLHLANAARHGARVLADAAVQRVDLSGGRATGVSGTLSTGRRFEVRARQVVVAAGALRTPLVLRRSGLGHPGIGANLHLHPTAAIGARIPQRVDMWRGTMQAARSLEHVRDGILIESAPAHPGLLALAFPWDGSAAHSELMRDIGHYAPLIGIVRDQDAGRVSLSRSGRARIEYRLSERDAVTARKGLVALARLARAGGATRLVALGTPAAWHDVGASDERSFEAYLRRLSSFDFAPNRGTLFSAHQMGTARAGGNE
ncbi:MAG: GMC family oxidoreductase N-terminal domain-containing protein, partial [Candidatus Limnocylindrales bacterium]